MPCSPSSSRAFASALALLVAIPATAGAQGRVVELEFAEPPAGGSAGARTLKSIVKVRDIGEKYATGGLYLLTHYGDREELFRAENRKTIDHPWINESWRFCSAFFAAHGDSVTMGRNWDNQNVGSVIVSLRHPDKGYSSVSFSRAIDLGFPLNMDLAEITSSPWGERLLLAPFYAMGGINERGLAVENPGVRAATVEPVPGKERVFQTFLIRKILDQAGSVDEAVALADRYLPFDIDTTSVNAHLLVSDASGRSVVLEYGQGRWQRTYAEGPWQVLTNKPVYQVPEAERRRACWRYQSLAGALERTHGDADWKAGLKMLHEVSQKGTTWSVVYSLATRDIHFSVYQDWDTVYHLKPF